MCPGHVTSSVPQGSILGPTLFILILFNINGIDSGIWRILRKFGDDTDLSGAVDTLVGRDDIQRDPEGSRSGPM